MGKLVSAFACSHAPQIVTNPSITNEYFQEVKEVQKGIVQIGKKLKDCETQILLMIGADHLESLFLDNYPSILVPFCSTTKGQMAGEKYEYEIDYDFAESTLTGLIERGFDVSFSQEFKLDHPFRSPLKWIEQEFICPILPIHINSNVPPVITKKRAFEFGIAIRDIIQKDTPADLNVSVLGTGGLSHFPGTPMYGKVDVDFDRKFLEMIETGKGEKILEVSDRDLQLSGNLEIRTWIAAMGTTGTNRGKVLFQVPTFHIDYAAVEFEI